jgi:hypothetical protein
MQILTFLLQGQSCHELIARGSGVLGGDHNYTKSTSSHHQHVDISGEDEGTDLIQVNTNITKLLK